MAGLETRCLINLSGDQPTQMAYPLLDGFEKILKQLVAEHERVEGLHGNAGLKTHFKE